MKNYTISFGTVCMNRLHHIQKTLAKNIQDNADYSDAEFVVLDYNSSDGLEEWIKQEMKEHLESGILKYYKTEEPLYFDRSHSRNLLFKLCKGEIICNIDADNYAGKGFAEYINQKFNENNNIFLVADTKRKYYFLRNAFGRFCVKKSDYIKLRGLDEEMKSYGSETVDLCERLSKNGNTEIIIENTSYLDTISHGDEERIANEYFLKSLDKLFIRYISHFESEMLFLFKDGSFEKNKISSKTEDPYLPAALVENTHITGKWKQNGDTLILESTLTEEYSIHKNILSSPHKEDFYFIDNDKFLFDVAKNYSFISNQQKKKKNQENYLNINPTSFGKGKVRTTNKEEIVLN